MRSKRMRMGILALTSIFAATQAQARDPAGASASDESSQSGSQLEEVSVTGRFVDTGAASATKQSVSTLDTPFSVSAYTQDFMKSVDTTQVADLYRYMTGLQKAGNTGYDLTLRGFSTTDSDRNTILVDGLPGLAVRFGSPPTVGTDHIEVVKGAASLLYGAVQPGGFVNMITKKPSSAESTVVSIRGTTSGSGSGSRTKGGDVSVDSTGPIDSNGKLLYRFVAQVSDDDKFRDFSYEKALYIAPSLTWNATDRTSITFLVEHRAVQSNYASLYLLAPRLPQGANVSYLAPPTTNYMAPGDFLHETGMIETALVNHRFDNGVRWTFEVRRVDHRDSASAWDITRYDRKDPTFQTLDLRARGQQNKRVYTFGDTYFTVPFQTLGLSHRMIAGLNLGKETDDFARTQFCDINSPDKPVADATCNPTAAKYTVSVINPNFSNLPPRTAFGQGVITPASRSRNFVSGVGSGAYLSDLITLGEHWKASVGLRYAREDQKNFADLYEPPPVVGDAHVISSAWLPQAGLIFEPTRSLSFYTSYSTSFSPVPPGTQHVDGSYDFKPTQAKGYEVGAKANLDDGKVSFTAALFKIDQTNTIVPSSSAACSTGSCSDQIGAARSQGLELELSAIPIVGWTLIAGYAHTRAVVTENPDALSGPVVGGLLPNSPLNAAHLWSRYDIQSGPLMNLGFGIGYSYTSDRIAYSPTIALPVSFTIPSYQVVDIGMYYSLPPHFDATLKVNNLFDRNYYLSGTVTQGKVNIVPGNPRAIQATLGYRF
jgi:iron complex outermembrane receptor protein